LFSIPEKANVFLLLALVVLLGVLGDSWFDAHRTQEQLRATMETTNKTIAAAASRESNRDDQLRKALAAISELKNRVQTPAQAIAALPAALPKLPEPIVIAPATNATAAAPGQKQTEIAQSAAPAASATVQIPQVDLKPLYDAAEDCQACQAKLSAVQSDLADEKSQLGAVTVQRDAALKTAKGGTLWTRAKRAAKWFAIGAACGALAAKATR
jgi:hypothetical protein